MNNSNRTAVIILGDLSEHSLLRQQLELDSLFEYRIQDSLYFESCSSLLPHTASAANLDKLIAGSTCPSVGQIISLLGKALPDWRDFRTLIFYPANLYFPVPDDLDNLLYKLIHLSGEISLVWERSSILRVAPESLLRVLSTTSLFDIENIQRQKLHQFEVTDLNSPRGIWNIGSSQTSARNFNSLSFQLPYVTKKSMNREKVEDEYHYLKDLPVSVRAYFPQVGEMVKTEKEVAYQVEFVPLLDMSRFLIHGRLLSGNLFNGFLSEIAGFFSRCPTTNIPLADYKRMLYALFVEKARERLQDLKKVKGIEVFFHRCNGLFEGGIDGLAEKLDSALQRKIASMRSESSVLHFSHGDLCFSNILFNSHTFQIKLIDPKGSRHSSLPIYYDLAKLSHSIHGGYDFIMNGQCELLFDENLSVDLVPKAVDRALLLRARSDFDRWLKQLGYDVDLVRLGEASLFLSMLPLHAESPARMLLQVCAAIQAYRAGLGEA